MSAETGDLRLKLLERIDLALAERMADNLSGLAEEQLVPAGRRSLGVSPAQRDAWIAGVLGLRGFRITEEEVATVLAEAGDPGRYRPEHQEWHLIHGLQRVLQRLLARSGDGAPPDGWFLVDLFKDMTRGLARFRNNAIRRDEPWDGLLHVRHPDSGRLSSQLDRFRVDECYLDMPVIFRTLHPVRQAFRVLWRYGRLAPHPDLNLPMAFVAMTATHLAMGYPLVAPVAGDRRSLNHLLSGPPPIRLVAIELRLLNELEMASQK